MSNQATLESYEADANGYIDSRSPDQSVKFTKWIIDGIKDYPKTKKIFEIGTGTGYDADYIESLGYSVVRSDGARSMVDFNKKRGKTMVKFDIVRDEFPDVYGAIIAVNVMQHLTHDEFIVSIRKIVSALEHRGRFLFSITTGDDSDEWHEDKGGPRYFMKWNPKSLKRELEKAGFEIIYQQEIGYKSWVDIIVEKI